MQTPSFQASWQHLVPIFDLCLGDALSITLQMQNCVRSTPFLSKENRPAGLFEQDTAVHSVKWSAH